MDKLKRKPPAHCWLFKARWRATSLTLRIESNDLEYAYKKAENTVKKMLGGVYCMSLDCIEQVY